MKTAKLVLQIVLMIFFVHPVSAQTDLVVKPLFKKKIEIKIPSGFKIMDEDMVNLKYPKGNPPSLIYTDEAAATNVAFSLTKNYADQGRIVGLLSYFEDVFKGSYPTAEWLDKGVAEYNGRKVGYLEFITQAIDTKVYNLIFYTDTDEKLLLCTFNCVVRDIDTWKNTAHEIMESLVVK